MNQDSIPIKAQDIYFEWCEENGFLIQTTKGKLKVLNYSGAIIWDMIDGKKTVFEITSMLERNFQEKFSNINKDLVDFLYQLLNRSLIYLKEE